MDRPHEIEAALIVRSNAPDAVGRRLAGLPTLGEFSLLPRATETIEDTYFDTPDRSLQARLIALRLRRLHGATLLTMKADSRSIAAGADRLELESAWSPSVLHEVLTELRSRGVGLPDAPGEPGSVDPSAVMGSLGFEEVQARTTRRTPRDVVARGAESEPVAELAVDAVTYRFRDGRARIHEVEVEAKGNGDAGTVERVTTSLLAAFPAELRPWRHGKLPTGKAIQQLLAAGRLDGLLGRDGTLQAAAYGRIEELLEGGAPSQEHRAPD